MELSKIQKLCFNQVSDKGFYDKWNNARTAIIFHKNPNFQQLDYIIDLAEFALMNSEISEAMEEIRNGDRLNAVKELAGCVIRILCYCENQKIDLESNILSEIERNKTRPKYHGRLVI